MAWIKFHSELWDSWKVLALANAIKINEAEAVGHLVGLWCFAERNAWKTGDLTLWGAFGVARAARFSGDADLFVKAMQEVRLFDKGTLKIHEWEVHQAAMIHNRSRGNVSKCGENADMVRGGCGENPRLDKIRVDKIREDKKTTICAEAQRKTFVKPTLDQVKAYITENKYSVDPDKWLAHYEANGWRVGRNPMKDWKAAVRTWTKSEYAKPATREITARQYDIEKAKQRRQEAYRENQYRKILAERENKTPEQLKKELDERNVFKLNFNVAKEMPK